MYCSKCEFEIKGNGQRECPVCGGPLIIYMEQGILSEESTKVAQPDILGETARGSKQPTFDLESTLNIDNRGPISPEPAGSVPGFSAPVSGPKAEEGSTKDVLASVLDEFDPVEKAEEGSTKDVLACVLDEFDPVEKADTPESDKSKQKQKRLSKVLPAITVLAVFIIAAVGNSIFYPQSQPKSFRVIQQQVIKVAQKTDKVLGAILGSQEEKVVVKEGPVAVEAQPLQKAAPRGKDQSLKEKPVYIKQKEKVVVKEESAADGVQPVQEAAAKEKDESLKAKPAGIARRDARSSEMKVPLESTAKKKKLSVKPIAKQVSPGGVYSIHIGSYRKRDVANSEANRLVHLGFDAYVQTPEREKEKIWHRVKIGNFSTPKEARDVQKELKLKDPELQPYIVKRTQQLNKAITKEEIKPLTKKALAVVDIKPQPEAAAREKEQAVKAAPAVEKATTEAGKEPVIKEEPLLVEAPWVPEAAAREEEQAVKAAPAVEKTTTEAGKEPVTKEEPPSIESQPEQKTAVREKEGDDKAAPANTLIEDTNSLEMSVPPKNTPKEEELVIALEKASSSGVVYLIQTGSYKIKKIAFYETIRLKFMGFDDAYVKTDKPGEEETLHRVIVGKFSTLEDAQKVQNELRLKDPGLMPVIVKHNGDQPAG